MKENVHSKEGNGEAGILILDIPVIHKGYIDLLRKYDGRVEALYLIGEDILVSLGAPKEIRSVDPETIRDLLKGLGLSFNIEVLNLDTIKSLLPKKIISASDVVSRRLRERHLLGLPVEEETIFLRWDESTVTSPRPTRFDEETSDPFHIQMIERTKKLADNSSDWWRQVGVVVVRNGNVLVEAYNQALPTEHKPYIDGNPRDFIKAGTLSFLSATVHAEQAAISKAAGLGIKLQGADLYLNSYPCPPCATQMSLAGIKRCFFSGGNAYLDASEVLKKAGIKTIFVNEEELPDRKVNG